MDDHRSQRKIHGGTARDAVHGCGRERPRTNTSGIVVDLTQAHLADDSVASAAHAAHHRARIAGAEFKVVVQPGRGGGYYHMAGLELTIPTFSQLGGAIEL